MGVAAWWLTCIVREGVRWYGTRSPSVSTVAEPLTCVMASLRPLARSASAADPLAVLANWSGLELAPFALLLTLADICTSRRDKIMSVTVRELV